jgi:hypothetical protein
MKILIALLIVINPIGTFAQKNSLFADAGLSLDGIYPGCSITYNHNFTKRFSLGVGLQGYTFTLTATAHQFLPAVFADVRYNFLQRKKGALFLFLDLGSNFYPKNDYQFYDGYDVYDIHGNAGFYTGLGLGYFRCVTKRGWGPYASLKVISNAYYANDYNIIARKDEPAGWLYATLAISVGFKF